MLRVRKAVSGHWPRLLDPKLFPAFIAAAERGDVVDAAEATQMTSSGIWQHVEKLEAEIGRPLFLRLGSSLRLTRTGQLLVSHICQQADSVESLFERLTPERESLEGVVSIALPASCLCSSRFKRFLRCGRAVPELRFRFSTGSQGEIAAKIAGGQADLGFLRSKREHAALTFEPFCEEECVFVSAEPAPSDPDPERILRTPLIRFPGSDEYWQLWRDATHACMRCWRGPSIAGEIDSVEGALEMVVAGVGAAVLPRSCVDRALAEGQLNEHPLSSEPVTYSVYLARATACKPSRRVQCVLGWLSEEASRC